LTHATNTQDRLYGLVMTASGNVSDGDDLQAGATQVARVLRKHGYEAYFAGGCVRDLLLGIRPKDYDIATNAVPEQIKQCFRRTVEVGAAFGVVRVSVGRGLHYEVATYRSDGTYSDGRRPDNVDFSNSKEEDLKRRDFTINAMLFDPDSGEVIDIVGGREDLKRGIVRAVGDPELRFHEDRLRMLRAVRFAARFGFTVHEQTLHAMHAHAFSVGAVSSERISIELDGAFGSLRPAQALDLLLSTGLLRAIFPWVEGQDGAEWRLALRRLEQQAQGLSPEARGSIVWAILMLHLSRSEVEADLCRMRRSRKFIQQVLHLYDARTALLTVELPPSARIVDLLTRPDRSVIVAFQMSLLGIEHPMVERLRAAHEVLLADPLPAGPFATGQDLLALGLPPGPRFKALLDAVEAARLERRLHTREEAIDWIRQQMAS
jgi:poly(A) polymerase